LQARRHSPEGRHRHPSRQLQAGAYSRPSGINQADPSPRKPPAIRSSEISRSIRRFRPPPKCGDAPDTLPHYPPITRPAEFSGPSGAPPPFGLPTHLRFSTRPLKHDARDSSVPNCPLQQTFRRADNVPLETVPEMNPHLLNKACRLTPFFCTLHGISVNKTGRRVPEGAHRQPPPHGLSRNLRQALTFRTKTNNSFVPCPLDGA